jgi:hypothetical protein
MARGTPRKRSSAGKHCSHIHRVLACTIEQGAGGPAGAAVQPGHIGAGVTAIAHSSRVSLAATPLRSVLKTTGLEGESPLVKQPNAAREAARRDKKADRPNELAAIEHAISSVIRTKVAGHSLLPATPST